MPHDDYEDPKKRDPRFPDRPTHPDFARLSEVVQDHDIRAERLGVKPTAILGVDEDSFMYFLENRLGIFAQRTGIPVFDNPSMKAVLGALYMDAFALGKDYAQAQASDVTVQIEGEYGVTDGSIHIHVDGEERVMWDSAEWVEDPSLVYVIVNAVRKYLTDEED